MMQKLRTFGVGCARDLAGNPFCIPSWSVGALRHW